MTVLVFLDPAYPAGRTADASAPQLLVTDLGVTRGDGIFESLLAVGGVPRKPDAHLDRMEASARSLDLELPARSAWVQAIDTALAEHSRVDGSARAAVKLVATRGVEGSGTPSAWVQVSPAADPRPADGLAVLMLDRGYDSTVAGRAPWLLLGAKTLSYAVNMAALRYAKANGADDVIFTSSDGKVLEGPTSTVVLATERNGIRTLLTPERKSGILAGTTQSALFAAAEKAGWELGYGPLEPEDLMAADGVWLLSSIRLLAPVTSIDGRSVPTPRRLTDELLELVETASLA